MSWLWDTKPVKGTKKIPNVLNPKLLQSPKKVISSSQLDENDDNDHNHSKGGGALKNDDSTTGLLLLSSNQNHHDHHTPGRSITNTKSSQSTTSASMRKRRQQSRDVDAGNHHYHDRTNSHKSNNNNNDDDEADHDENNSNNKNKNKNKNNQRFGVVDIDPASGRRRHRDCGAANNKDERLYHSDVVVDPEVMEAAAITTTNSITTTTTTTMPHRDDERRHHHRPFWLRSTNPPRSSSTTNTKTNTEGRPHPSPTAHRLVVGRVHHRLHHQHSYNKSIQRSSSSSWFRRIPSLGTRSLLRCLELMVWTSGIVSMSGFCWLLVAGPPMIDMDQFDIHLHVNTAAIKSTIRHKIQLLRRRFQSRRKVGSAGSGNAAAIIDEMIDMRQLNYQLPFDNPDGGVWKQGWELEPVEVSYDQTLTVFVVPHTHCDPGWLKTFDDYFQSQTKEIITTVIQALQKDSRRKFIWAEMSYFAWWWEEQSFTMQSTVRNLLERGQLEFVTGGWVQPDEANSELYAIEIQLQEGHDWIRHHLGKKFIPKYSWSIDPFGYSPTMAWLLHKYKFEGMVIQRIHYAVKKELAKRQHLEFMWRQTWDPEGKHDILTHVMPFYSYDIAHTCGPDPSICCQFDFARDPIGSFDPCPWNIDVQLVTENNTEERATLLWDQFRKKASLYRSNVVLIPFGDDFRYQFSTETEAQYSNLQQLFDYMNEHFPGADVQFGTLSEYFRAIEGTFDPPVLKGSFFTYSDVNQDYWSGYFTSRVFDKALDRQLERVLYAAETLGGEKDELQDARRQLSLFQHHDGVTGTARDDVVQDYAQRMYRAIEQTQSWMIQKLLTNTKYADMASSILESEDLSPCWKANEPRQLGRNVCLGENSEHPAVLVYNPARTSQTCGNVVVKSYEAVAVHLPCEVPGLLPESKTRVAFNAETGLMEEPIQEEWKVWRVTEGGAYLFVPFQLRTFDLVKRQVVIEDGGYVISTPQWKRTVIEREVPDDYDGVVAIFDFIYETELTQDNREWFVRFGANITNGGIFHTDLNGFNYDTHRFRADMPIQSQVFPMPTLASIEDDQLRMTVLSDHAQGTASLRNGTIDVWLDRRLAQDDNRGLGQGVQDNRRTLTRFRVILERSGFDTSSSISTREFKPTAVCTLLWDQLQHPLEMFGKQVAASSEKNEQFIVDPQIWQEDLDQRREARDEKRRRIVEEQQLEAAVIPRSNMAANQGLSDGIRNSIEKMIPTDIQGLLFGGRGNLDSKARGPEDGTAHDAAIHYHTTENTIIPFVYMVYKRVDYMKASIESLRQSDFPRDRVPLIISIDGHVPEMITYIDTLKGDFNVITLFHPYSCFEHPNIFPGNDPKLNANYKGDTYGNPRSSWATCCKHHFTWMLKTVFSMDRFDDSHRDTHTFFFIEEDYVVAPTVYSALISGMNVMAAHEQDTDGGFLGIVLEDPEAKSRDEPTWLENGTWYADAFRSGPMTMSRKVFEQLRNSAEHYCRFDEYNWDWSIVHVQYLSNRKVGGGGGGGGVGASPHLAHTVLVPSRSQVKHIGIEEGMHADQYKKIEYGKEQDKARMELKQFSGTKFWGNLVVPALEHTTGFGGWGHPADQEHCMQLLQSDGL